MIRPDLTLTCLTIDLTHRIAAFRKVMAAHISTTQHFLMIARPTMANLHGLVVASGDSLKRKITIGKPTMIMTYMVVGVGGRSKPTPLPLPRINFDVTSKTQTTQDSNTTTHMSPPTHRHQYRST